MSGLAADDKVRKHEKVIDVDDVLEYYQWGNKLVYSFLASGLLAFADATTHVVGVLVIPHLTKDWNLGNFEQLFLSGSFFVGLALSCLVWTNFADRFGRKKTIIITCVGTAIFDTLSCLAPEYISFVILRTCGSMFGGGLAIIYGYVGEYSAPKYRGVLMGCFALFYSCSALYVTTLGWIMLDLLKIHWRIFLFADTLLLIFVMIFIFPIPRSLRWLGLTGNRRGVQQEIRSIRKWGFCCKCVRPRDTSIDDLFANAPGQKMVVSQKSDVPISRHPTDGEEQEQQGEEEVAKEEPMRMEVTVTTKDRLGSYRDLLSLELAYMTIYGIFLAYSGYFIMFCTPLVLPFFFPVLNSREMYIGMMVYAFGMSLSCFVTGLTLDLLGRRNSVLIAAIFSAIFMCLFIIPWDSIPYRMVVCFFLGFSVSWTDDGMFVLVLESFPTNVRATACGIIVGVGSSGATISGVIVQSFLRGRVWSKIIIVVMCFATAMLGFCYPLDMTKKKLHDIKEDREKRKGVGERNGKEKISEVDEESKVPLLDAVDDQFDHS